MKERKLNFIREPIFQFFAIGLLLFFIYTFITSQTDERERTIVVSEAQVGLLVETFEKTWNREPTETELKAQIENYIKDEVFFKEAVAMGLDKSDPAVKRRLRQMMELMMDDAATIIPSEAQLQNYLEEHQDIFMEDPDISFSHIFFQMDDKAPAEKYLSNLNRKLLVDKSKVARLSLIPESFDHEKNYSIDRLFGNSFAEKIFTLEINKWQGPINSAYGWHLVYITEIVPGTVPELENVWDEVEREWANEQKKIKTEALYQSIKAGYKIKYDYAR